MEINIKKDNNIVKIADLNYGSCFKDGKNFLIKTSDEGMHETICVNLKNGDIEYYNNDAKVKYIPNISLNIVED